MVGFRRRRADGRDRHAWLAAADRVLPGSNLVDHLRMACTNSSGPCGLREATNFGSGSRMSAHSPVCCGQLCEPGRAAGTRV